jgi:hypothetical protein
MILGALLLSCVVLIEAFLFLQLDRQVRGIFATTRDALCVLGDGKVSDDDKERCTRLAARVIVKMTALFTLKLAALVGVLCAFFFGVAAISSDGAAALLAALVSPTVIVALALAAMGYVWIRNAVLG